MDPFTVAMLAAVAGISAVFGIYRGLMIMRAREKEKSVIRFKRIRDAIKDNREELRRKALTLVKEKSKYFTIDDEVPLLVGKKWLPDKPIPLERVTLESVPDPGVNISLYPRKLPIHDGGKYKKYSDAIVDLDKPKKFDPNDQYRLLEVDGTRLTFSKKKYVYFDKIDYGGYLLYELASGYLSRYGAALRSNRKRVFKKLRTPSDYVTLTGISTLTILHDGEALRIIMHIRGKSETAYAMGTNHVIPAGEFQPSCKAPTSFKSDFDFWKNIMREYAEEIGGMDEYDGNSSSPFKYETEPFMSLQNEKTKNNIKVFYLGIGLDVMTLQGEILTAAVFKEETFKKIFPKVINENREGKIITDIDRWGRPFTQEEYNSYLGEKTLATGEAILNIAWRNRRFFKACFD